MAGNIQAWLDLVICRSVGVVVECCRRSDVGVFNFRDVAAIAGWEVVGGRVVALPARRKQSLRLFVWVGGLA